MLVVIVIITILMVAVLPMVLEGLDRRGVREGSRLVQAALTAARDRALSQQRTYGVRFIRDQSDRWLVTSMQYVAEPAPYTRGTASVLDPITLPRIITGPVTNGWNGLVQIGDRIRLLDSGPIYTITGFAPGAITIDRPYIGPQVINVPYKIFRRPQPVAGAEPLNLPEDVVINVSPNAKPAGLPSTVVERRSRFIPYQWGFETLAERLFYTGGDNQPGFTGVDDDGDGITDDPNFDGSGLAELGFPGTNDVSPAAWPPMDVLFAPSGLPTGVAADRPMIHIWVEKRGSTTAVAGGGVNIEDALLVTLFTRTGFAGAFEVELRDMDNNNLTNEYYYYAEQAFGSATP